MRRGFLSKLPERKKCRPTCPYFRCAQKALFIKRPRDANPRQSAGIAWCNWVGDVCVGASCSYAFCEKRALLPNGMCGLEERTATKTAVRSIEEEARREEDILKRAKEKVLKKIGSEYLE
ncbi:MAG: hypothetical protein DRJ33_01065 [Candidatus Methanomethylicota archaeon]|uniref:Uncharacterized protein n=1 Tax=Thermoproteota archaeon TaxID=2056631 RepID=A0A497F260_9CREN|nr:MAG: hypothetical protein DRJ33_01065 [Candidatus Verstraetearchaeota archaeon]